MIDLRSLQGNIIVSASGIGISFLGKKIFHKELIPVGSIKQAGISFGFLLAVTVLGKLTMDEMVRFNIVRFDTTGKAKHPLEGFIGPYEKDDLLLGLGPNRKNRQIIQDMKKDNRRQ